MKPTPEQIEAAKAWQRGEETREQYQAIRDAAEGSPIHNVVAILLAALESAEADLKGTMQAGGYEHFTAQVRNAQQQAHNAIYGAQQLEKKLEAAEADSARLPMEALGFALAWACHALDEGKDPRGMEVPALIDAWGKAQSLAARKEAQP